MKNYFIINPMSGNGKGLETVKKEIELLDIDAKSNHEFKMILTTKPLDATLKVKDICKENKDREINIFACGGDGTCFEVLNGLVGYDNVNFGIIPVGSCNDFLKTFEDYDFLSLKKQLTGHSELIDILEVNDEYALNVANFGFDAKVNRDQITYRKKSKTVTKAYNRALFKNIISPKKGDEVMVYVDDKLIYNKKMMLATVANAMYYGGGYKCAPLASVTDGMLDVLVVKKISILTFARLVKFYKKGEHLNNERFKKILSYERGKEITISSKNDLVGCLDGETRVAKRFKIKIHEKKVKFIIPNK